MRKWRVGTLSLGVLMIALGVIMLAAQFKQVAILDTLIIWWPIILVLIGAEILMQVYTAEEQQPKIKYDAFSIFIIFIMVFFSIGMYALTSTGVIEGIAWMVESSIVSVEIPSQRTAVDEGVEKVVVSASRGRVDVKKSSTSEVVVFGEAVVNAANNEEANALAEQNMAVIRREGNTLFIQFLSNTWSGDFKPGIREIRHTLMLPQDVEVEVSGPNYFNLDIDGEAFGKDWLIKGDGSVSITTAASSDLTIDAQVRGRDNFGGNANWEIEQRSGVNTNGGSEYEGHLKWGDGTNRVNILLDGGEIVINEI
ncbi:MAG: hypothetical protein WCS98_02025 [Bacillota bacterium]|nr:hypothetical protein [Bacillota bacterium]MDD3298294.1 hypothetical protein [Bacillota bacterium]MDD3850328.1 hypothetical protein [Bacillota bacterium]MDD4707000.1 hypothetical protein [Bacillota bacterium]